MSAPDFYVPYYLPNTLFRFILHTCNFEKQKAGKTVWMIGAKK